MHKKLAHYDEVSKALYFTDAAKDAVCDMNLPSLPPHMKEKELEEAYEYLKRAYSLLEKVKARHEEDISEDIGFSLENM